MPDAKRPRRPLTYIEGFTESMWKSMAIKAVRMGWPAGLEMAARRLHPGVLRSVLHCQFFEDTFPTLEELPECIDEVERQDWEALCRRETHHARGYTKEFVDMWFSKYIGENQDLPWVWEQGVELGLSMTPRTRGVFCCWVKVNPRDAGVKREIDMTPWTGMPLVMADKHTFEGRRLGVDATIISGHASQHFVIERIVRDRAMGWPEIWRRVHEGGYAQPATDRYGEILGSVGNGVRMTNGAYQLTFSPDGTAREDWSGKFNRDGGMS